MTLRVLYLHGFEENADSPKPQALIKDHRFDVHLPKLKVYFNQSKSPLVHALYQPWLLVPLVLGAALGLVLSNQFNAPAWVSCVCGIAIGGALIYAKRAEVVAGAVRGSYLASFSSAKAALAASKPDVVVGFSWGGALACDLVAQRLWSGPLVLMAPAHRKLQDLQGLQGGVSLPSLPPSTVVIHSAADTLVGIADSRALVAASPGTRLIEVAGDPHAMWSIAKDGTLVRAVLEVASAAGSSLRD